MIHLTFFQMLFALVIGHCLGDFPLQGEFLSRAKNRRSPLPGVPWATALWSHGLIHGGIVWLITENVWLGLAEVVAHAIIDDAKCAGRFGQGAAAFDLDQTLHLVCKAGWAALALWWPFALAR